ncbi:hypothetical protein Godav_023134 [Gossypium davidsonii]|uniref:DUF4283 domain-containing protein n=1 Tax=Gossypium davidsonii TaxID=34287 RepID=A0A7J8SQL8_GOSDV|nr:hypothetical protein [Gossypium davidsonii]
MEADIANLNLDDQKEAPIPCEGDLHKEDEDHQFCLVGKALTDCVIHFPVLDGMPWSFSRHLLVFHQLMTGEDPKQVPLNHTYFWIQVYNLSYGAISEGLARKLGDFIGQFIQCDDALISRGERRYLRFRIKVDVRLALKRKKKLSLGQGKESYAYFQYEGLSLFCFLCDK